MSHKEPSFSRSLWRRLNEGALLVAIPSLGTGLVAGNPPLSVTALRTLVFLAIYFRLFPGDQKLFEAETTIQNSVPRPFRLESNLSHCFLVLQSLLFAITGSLIGHTGVGWFEVSVLVLLTTNVAWLTFKDTYYEDALVELQGVSANHRWVWGKLSWAIRRMTFWRVNNLTFVALGVAALLWQGSNGSLFYFLALAFSLFDFLFTWDVYTFNSPNRSP